jgi:phage shock protein C
MAKKSSRRAAIKRLYRSGKDKILGGVCGGMAEYFNIDPTIVRILWILFSLAYGSGILAYIIAWIIIPRNPKDRW